MSNMFSGRAGPLLIASGIFGGLLYSTAGGRNQPRPRAVHDAGVTSTMSSGGFDIGEKMEEVAGVGGKHARKNPKTASTKGLDKKYVITDEIDTARDARYNSCEPDVYSKRTKGKREV
ncbi:hypothetical protein QBC35DRAFT_552275 [Podospora australis]|uniref:Uncharacterized protein n=1 Tax=Podospora australis TaxID=1536484 RepID=A0AAN6WU49_9PEZI|nr:hypothetical protein QBC35DRAFT_552275 [Podospora australis]